MPSSAVCTGLASSSVNRRPQFEIGSLCSVFPEEMPELKSALLEAQLKQAVSIIITWKLESHSRLAFAYTDSQPESTEYVCMAYIMPVFIIICMHVCM